MRLRGENDVPSELVVIICTGGRPAVLDDTLCSIDAQQRRPDRIVLSITDPRDIGEAAMARPDTEIIVGERGLTLQRNRALDRLRGTEDIVVFLDDDVLLRRDFLAHVERLFQAFPETAIASGYHIALGRQDDSFTTERAQALVDADERRHQFPDGPMAVRDWPVAYGNNMSVRGDVARKVRFDERLRHYAYLEDYDYGNQCRAHGRVLRVEALRLVHLQTSSGRMSGLRLGFSQIMNPTYLFMKGTLGYGRWLLIKHFWLTILLSNAAANLPGRTGPNRAGRFRGNLHAIGMILRGRIAPEAIADL